MTKRDGGPAFPRAASGQTACQAGMTLRDYAVIHILAGLVANPNIRPDLEFVPMACSLADAMLAARAGEDDGQA